MPAASPASAASPAAATGSAVSAGSAASADPAASTEAVRPARRPTFHSLRIERVERLCEDAVAVTFEVPEGLAAAYAFRPGQTLTLRKVVDGTDERRSYSICAPVGGPLRIAVREVPGGLFSRWLVREARPGEEVEVLTPSGLFTPELGVPADHVLLAAGSGITPMLSIAASVLAADRRSTVTLLYGNRRSDTVMFADELADLKDRYLGRFQLVHVLSRETRDAELLSGRLDPERVRALLTALVDVGGVGHWWLCGPFGMVAGAKELLAELEVPGERVHQELFHAEDEPLAERDEDWDRGDRADGGTEDAPGERSEVTVVLDGRGSTLTLPRDRSILDGAQRSRPDLPFACKGGVCGTCRALVTEGEVEMRRNFALEEKELAAGYVLTCQARPLTDRVTVDYDR
ncbi:1,2-phenylacetyl-CoA epoxidase subunit PaaE [Kitasatospora aureofaciens]|uniref:3-ketosteroid-9-alpha-monooxygenase, ferredoxin reductase component n=1 Tax=Kitasatospora aureofaciens TaxID=1894 RepID=A0A8H9LSK5_KITAU|nr:1,2-phenylacetyl-CoA epoxidase subunit PaaE [Kitasatospora aureofaciens]ARF77795.1 phenylacetic acid degradation protein [Kitasatospora aureofaciens]GGU73836.1 phenylacetic acid degradation protein [Kitasatospora aureofaciens]